MAGPLVQLASAVNSTVHRTVLYSTVCGTVNFGTWYYYNLPVAFPVVKRAIIYKRIIINMSKLLQLGFCIAGIYFFYLVYGIYQEV
jgi:hypothetical protein